jgi:hypothetical protein
MTEGCVCCDHDRLREADPYFEDDLRVYGGIAPKAQSAGTVS